MKFLNTTFLRRFMITFGLIILWKFLYPFLVLVLESAPRAEGKTFGLLSSDSIQGTAVALLVALTLWIHLYIDGFFLEWDLLNYYPAEALQALLFWMTRCLLHFLLIPAAAPAMYWALIEFTSVPHSVCAGVAALYSLGALYYGITFPENYNLPLCEWYRHQ